MVDILLCTQGWVSAGHVCRVIILICVHKDGFGEIEGRWKGK